MYGQPGAGNARHRGRARRALWPYKLARFEERMDAIGSKRSWSSVEPADWKVAVTRTMGVTVALFGLLIFFDV